MSAPNLKPLFIVDDERSYTDLLGQVLSDHLRCPIKSFSRPLEALAALGSEEPGLIVTDYCMPQINGIEFIRRVQAISPNTPFLMITGHRMELEMTDYSDVTSLRIVLAKPLSGRALATEIVRIWPESARLPVTESAPGNPT